MKFPFNQHLDLVKLVGFREFLQQPWARTEPLQHRFPESQGGDFQGNPTIFRLGNHGTWLGRPTWSGIAAIGHFVHFLMLTHFASVLTQIEGMTRGQDLHQRDIPWHGSVARCRIFYSKRLYEPLFEKVE